MEYQICMYFSASVKEDETKSVSACTEKVSSDDSENCIVPTSGCKHENKQQVDN